ncbi:MULTISPECIES: MFS transporter [Thalassospira]|uniref:MFS transporter n=1 Tax=Thalassospira aquimaris TaxID=3037796 RepID=A0ABT6GIA1_9PROT|nr:MULTISPECIES: MFS transporter [Thalassospira]MDG4721820.1 MFS transporter [Thalassospira sp. FZY0004]
MIHHRTVIALGLAQLISWGTAYYLIGNFGTALAERNGWDSAIVYGGFSLALLVMGICSSTCGRLIDQYGGRPVLLAGSVLNALGCLILAFGDQVVVHFLGWIILGFAMRATLYDAAFATLARIGGPNAGRAMGQITLFGGLASTVFWPLGHMIESQFDLTIALISYAGFALLTIPLHLLVPAAAPEHQDSTEHTGQPINQFNQPDGNRRFSDHQHLCGILYAVIVTILNVVNAAMSAHMIPILIGIGLGTVVAIETASLRGIGQSLARAAEVLFGKRLAPTKLTVMATALLPLSFLFALIGDPYIWAVMTFTFVYGAANGVLTITRGTLPLMIFGNRGYGKQVGQLLVPGFFLSAIAPSLYDQLITRFGPQSAIWASSGLLLIGFISAIILYRVLTPNHMTKPLAEQS